MQGDLIQDALPDVIRRIYTRRLTGELKLSQYSVNKSIYFELGAIVFASSNDRNDRIGESMIRNGLLSQPDFMRASQYMTRGKRFGRILVELGIVDDRGLQYAVTFQILDIIYSIFTWSVGKYEFTATDKPVPDDLKLELSTASIILEGVRRIADIAIVQRGMGDLNRLIMPSTDPLLRTQTLSLKPIERALIAGITMPMNVLQAFMLVNAQPNVTLQALYGLISAGILERQPAPTLNRETGQLEVPRELIEQAATAPPVVPPKVAASVAKKTGSLKTVNMLNAMREKVRNTQDPYEILGITQVASRDEVRDAYYRLAKDFHPDRHLGASLETRREVDELFSRITEAYEAIRDREVKPTGTGPLMAPMPMSSPVAPSAPAQSSESTAQREARADNLFQDAKAKLSLRDYNGALPLLREAVKLMPDAARFQFVLGTTLTVFPKLQREAETVLRRAADLDPFNVAPLIALGQLYARAGMNIQAEKVFNEALKIDPDSKAARKGLESVGSGKSGGFLDKLFKR